MTKDEDEVVAAAPNEGEQHQSGPPCRGAAAAATFAYRITGHVAHARIEPLLRAAADKHDGGCRWVPYSAQNHPQNTSNHKNNDDDLAASIPDFLWENAPRHETKTWRDTVSCYSHLPNGGSILDSKWVLGRLLGAGAASGEQPPHLAVLETHCFQGVSGFREFAQEAGLLLDDNATAAAAPAVTANTSQSSTSFRDLMEKKDDGYYSKEPAHCNNNNTAPPPQPNLFVVKDSHSNGAGGIWVVGPANARAFAHPDNSSNARLYDDHTYVAQRYAWPPVLFRRRKCHVRVYALLTADGRAFCHRRCFLHVANDEFAVTATATKATAADDDNAYSDSVHITNCCANSHDPTKFAGEICADLEAFEHTRRSGDDRNDDETVPDHELTVGLGRFFPSVKASIAALAEKTRPFLQGGEANNGFEYLGLDFILAYRNNNSSSSSSDDDEPVAYLLEVNAPPSQDTATGLPHAEELHDEVIRDLLTLWVYPNVTGATAVCGGWRCVYTETCGKSVSSSDDDVGDAILPSKAAILNKIRWTLYERRQLSKASNKVNRPISKEETAVSIAARARPLFPYFSEGSSEKTETSQPSGPPRIFFENAGGTQVPSHVIDAVSSSLRSRHRTMAGAKSTSAAKATLSTILGASKSSYAIFLNSNASTLLFTLAQRYVQSGLLGAGDEIVICTENHQANIQPWFDAAKSVGAVVKWWDYPTTTTTEGVVAESLQEILSPKTRIIAVPQASNILGSVLDVGLLRPMVQRWTNGYAHMVVDGVAACPHRYPAVDALGVDWYVVSCHKLFGPHLGALCGRNTVVEQLVVGLRGSSGNATCGSTSSSELQLGTVNYEACEGVRGLGRYLNDLSSGYERSHPDKSTDTHRVERQAAGDYSNGSTLTCKGVREAFRLIEEAEALLIDELLKGLQASSKVRLIGRSFAGDASRIPVVSFVHEDISSSSIVTACSNGGVICRNGTFLSSERLQKVHAIDPSVGCVRFSLAHYNTLAEVNYAVNVLQSIPGWF